MCLGLALIGTRLAAKGSGHPCALPRAAFHVAFEKSGGAKGMVNAALAVFPESPP
jgi:hypothetical protein